MKLKNPLMTNARGSMSNMTFLQDGEGFVIGKGKIVYTTVTDTALNVPRKTNFREVVRLARRILPFLRLNFERRSPVVANYQNFLGKAMDTIAEIAGIPQPLDFGKICYTFGGVFQPVFTFSFATSNVEPDGSTTAVISWIYNSDSEVQTSTDLLSWLIVSTDFSDYDFSVTNIQRSAGSASIDFVVDLAKSYYFIAFFKGVNGLDQSTSVPLVMLDASSQDFVPIS